VVASNVLSAIHVVWCSKRLAIYLGYGTDPAETTNLAAKDPGKVKERLSAGRRTWNAGGAGESARE
jgi:hypothetical protein